jgi:uncharacterized membrane protein YoaK (UPF0700 family)
MTMTTDKAEKEESKSNAIHLLLLWFGFLAGAFAAPFLLDYFKDWTLILPALLLIFCGLLLSVLHIKL